jgi:hypothetical protein
VADTFMLDTNVVDKLVADGALVDRLQRLVGDGQVRLLFTHLQVDEVMETPESNPKRQQLVNVLARLPAELVPTYGFIVGRSRLDNARLTGDQGAALIERLRGPDRKHTEDAVIATTAWKDGATFVSAETRGGAVKRARREGISAMTFDEFAAHIYKLAASRT